MLNILKRLFGVKPSNSYAEITTFNKNRDHKSQKSKSEKIRKYPSEVVGESFYHNNLLSIAGGYSRDGYEIETIANVSSPPDKPDALQVVISNRQVGWIPATRAVEIIAQMQEEGVKSFKCHAKITGGWRTNQNDKGNFGVWLDIAKGGWVDLGTGKSPPTPEPYKRSTDTQKSNTNSRAKKASGRLKGMSVTFWGTENETLAMFLQENGATITKGVGKTTKFVVVNTLELTTGHKNSATYKKVHELNANGSKIVFTTAQDLMELLSE